jgi:hypothetical protein
MEKDLVGIHAMEVVLKKKGKQSTDAKQYVLDELQKATENLNWK